MATENEYKFLIHSIPRSHLKDPVRVQQGYLGSQFESTTRVRIMGSQAFITVKGLRSGISRAEFEYEIPVADAEHMLERLIPDDKQVRKIRYTHQHKGFVYTIDVFEGLNEGLVLAELELADPDDPFDLPLEWECVNVSENAKFYNNRLSNDPVSRWDNKPSCIIE